MNDKTGTFDCPICGLGEPHYHSEEEHAEYRARKNKHEKSQTEWIPADELKPDKGQRVLVWAVKPSGDGFHCVSLRDHYGAWEGFQQPFGFAQVKYWRALPDAPDSYEQNRVDGRESS